MADAVPGKEPLTRMRMLAWAASLIYLSNALVTETAVSGRRIFFAITDRAKELGARGFLRAWVGIFPARGN